MSYLNASNDDLFVNRLSLSPLLSKLTSVPGYPTKLKIYLTNSSPYWQVRCYFLGKVIVRSLKTTSKRDAIRLAKIFFNQCLMKQGKDPIECVPVYEVSTHTIEVVAATMLRSEEAKVSRAEISSHSYTMLCSRIRKHVLPFFSKIPVEHINYGHIESFLNFLSAKSYKPMTISQYLTALRKVLNTAHANGFIPQVPQFPKIRVTSTARGNFSATEYLELLHCAKKLQSLPETPVRITHRNTRNGIYALSNKIPGEMAWLIGFMVNSFVRPVDVKLIQHKHVEIIRGEHCYLRLSLPETKRHKSQVISLPAGVRIYEKLYDHFNEQGLAKPDDYLFLPKVHDRQAAITLLENNFRTILIHTNLRFGTQGQRRSLYSLRHSAITFRLLYGKGIDLLTLARNARTSLEMVDKFYASELTAEMNVGMLHSRR